MLIVFCYSGECDSVYRNKLLAMQNKLNNDFNYFEWKMFRISKIGQIIF